jgi:hypothetical protein
MNTDALQAALDQIKQAVDDAEAELMQKKRSPGEETTEPVDNPEEDAAEGEMSSMPPLPMHRRK